MAAGQVCLVELLVSLSDWHLSWSVQAQVGVLPLHLRDCYSQGKGQCLVGEEMGCSWSWQIGSGRKLASPPEEFAFLFPL